MARSLLDLLAGGKPEYEPCMGKAVHAPVAMAIAARLARIRGARVPFPVTEPGNPFDSWREPPAPEPCRTSSAAGLRTRAAISAMMGP